METPFSAWNPGLASEIPSAYRGLESIYNRDNVTSSIEQIDELRRITGLSPTELVVFRPRRLALHEMIVRISAEILVQEGDDEIALGRNFRRIAQTIWEHHIVPHLAEVESAHRALREKAERRVGLELQRSLYPPPAPPRRRTALRAWLEHWRKTPSPGRTESIEVREGRALDHFKQQGLAASDPFDVALYRSLYRILGALIAQRGFIGAERKTITTLVCDHICNNHGSEVIGTLVGGWVARAIVQQGYTPIGPADSPILISLKGPSAAGKSSLRPMLMRMMREQGMESSGYVTISPDIWRRLLLDYGALGDAYKYAGRMTSYEVMIIDSKLDQYVRDKADRTGAMPHLLVDRFRFDSFSTERIGKILHGTYVRHVRTLYMYFVVTPPAATVERGWLRGLATGRYKAVEDFLDHSVEAYTGMPRVLFKWLGYRSPRFHYRFLDNSVPKGTFPRTAAYGDQQSMTILDCRVLVDIERYRRINIHASNPDELYAPDARLACAENLDFLQRCLTRIPQVNFVDAASLKPYLVCSGGRHRVADTCLLTAKLKKRDQGAILLALFPGLATQEPAERAR